jgi:hypothetical protein
VEAAGDAVFRRKPSAHQYSPLPLLYIVADFLTIIQPRQTSLFQGGYVYENVFRAVIWLADAIALLDV